MVRQRFLEFRKRGGIVEHGKLTVGIAHVVSRAEFNGGDLDGRKFLEHHGERQLRKQGSEDSYAHSGLFLLGLLS